MRCNVLTKSLAGIDIPVLTITEGIQNYMPADSECFLTSQNPTFIKPWRKYDQHLQLADKQAIVITSRVHPGETNASVITEGIMNFLLADSEEAKVMR